VDRLTVSLVASPFVFAACALATRAPARRMAAALAGGVAFAFGNAAWDVLANAAGWWTYPGLGGASRGPALWYAAAGLSASGVALIGWRVVRRFGRRGLAAFLIGFAAYCLARDLRVAAAPDSVIQFAPGPVPRLADGVAALTLMAAALAVQFALGGDPQRLR
jgi:hypothetical protein